MTKWKFIVALAAGTFCLCGPVYGDVSFVASTPGDRVANYAHFSISGVIKEGDLADLRNSVGKHLAKSKLVSFSGGPKIPIVFLNSMGGSVKEALGIGRYLRELDAFTIVDTNARCASACVFVLAGGVQRAAFTGAKVGLHRPFFSDDTMTSLPSREAQRLYRSMANAIKLYLDDMDMPPKLFEAMLDVDSDDVKILTEREVSDFKLDGTDPAYSELKIARERQSYSPKDFLYLQCLRKVRKIAECKRRLGRESPPN